MTDKQKAKIEKIIEYFGKEYVGSYIRCFYPDADINNLTTAQAQKIFTGLFPKLPRRPITGVYSII